MSEIDNLEFEPAELKITLVTNIPKDVDYEKDILTFGTIYRPDLKVEGIKPTQQPYFTFNFSYDESILSSLSYADVVRTFFEKKQFINRLGNSSDFLIPKPEEGEDDKLFQEEKRRIIDNNIMLTLKYLLPTRFPVVNNHFNSYDVYKEKDSLSTLLYNPFLERKYIYLRLASGTYTLKKVIWLNDFLNHPDYQKYLDNPKVTTNIVNVTQKSSNSKLQKSKLTTDELIKTKQCYKKSCVSPYRDYLYVGIQEIDSSNFEIYVDVELLASELKPEDEGKVQCPYYGDYLGEELTTLIKEMNPKEKPLKGKVSKKPLFSVTTMASTKLGVVQKEKLDDKQKLLRAEEEKKYNEIDIDSRQNYEKIITPFFKSIQESKGLIKNNIKKHNINIKNFYLFLDDQNFSDLLNYLVEEENEKKKMIDKIFKNIAYSSSVYSKIKRNIDDSIDTLRKEKLRKSITTEEFEKEKTKFDLTKEFLEYLKTKNTEEIEKLNAKPIVGGRTIKNRKSSNKKYTRKHK
jgi:hypothetical protein